MIFICVGSREYQFNRLLREIDRLLEIGEISGPVFAQIGNSDYEPRYYPFERFIPRDRFQLLQQEADLIVSHGGTGALIGALKLGKRVIAVPRLESFGEHTDNHQTQISGVLAEEGYLIRVDRMEELGNAILRAFAQPIPRRYEKASNILQIIRAFINDTISS